MFHPLQIEITSLVLGMLTGINGFCWVSDEQVIYIMRGFEKFMVEYKLINKFDLIMRTIYNTDNVLFLMYLLSFLSNFLKSPCETSLRRQIICELYET